MTTWVVGSGNGLLPDGTKPLPEPVLDRSLKITALRLQSHPPEAPFTNMA